MAQKTCSVEGCERPATCRGLCSPHYQRQYRHGDPLGGNYPKDPFCSVEGCGLPTKQNGYCAKHYSMWRRRGDPLAEGKWRSSAPEPIVRGGVALILLSQDLFAVVDTACLPLVRDRVWHAGRYGATWYALSRAGGRNSKKEFMHRVVLGLGQDDLEVDHKNGNGLDNRKANLRLATRSQNAANYSGRANNVSGYRGVSKATGRTKWTASIKSRLIGQFETREEAARAYDEAAREAFGEFATLNFPD